ncbi:Plant self-incompatibility S1 [Vigna unguiculata]|uniref:S-protein homolog n=1 Tax=Vigna unguiculata TaxID=3917 RepID=A0A4D6M469_VIGUN|nr:Plant self-incompatibility S1 [Vigna unguiculata]
MDSISKTMKTLYWLLILALLLKDSESIDQLAPHKVTVAITNKLLHNKELSLHCKDKHHDLGPVTLKGGETYRFRFQPNFWIHATLYFCRFVWSGGDHRFDIYVEDRDMYCNDNLCSWEIMEKRPCDVSNGILYRKCYEWDKASSEKNNTLSS